MQAPANELEGEGSHQTKSEYGDHEMAVESEMLLENQLCWRRCGWMTEERPTDGWRWVECRTIIRWAVGEGARDKVEEGAEYRAKTS